MEKPAISEKPTNKNIFDFIIQHALSEGNPFSPFGLTLFILQLRRLNRTFKKQIDASSFWKDQVAYHHPFWKTSTSFSWPSVFNGLYDGLSKRDRKLIVLTKLGALEELKTYDLHCHELFLCVHDNLNLIRWATFYNHQHLLDYFFELLSTHVADKAPAGLTLKSSDNLIAKYMIICNQPAEKFLTHLNQQLQSSQSPEVFLALAKRDLITAAINIGYIPFEALTFLLEGEVDMEVVTTNYGHPDEGRKSLLQCAIGRQHCIDIRVVQLILKKGRLEKQAAIDRRLADAKALDYINYKETRQGQTALHIAIRQNADPAIISLLLTHGADVHANSHNGFTPLHYAAQHGNKENIRLLLEKGALLSGGYEIPLHYYKNYHPTNRDPEIIQMLTSGLVDKTSPEYHR